MTNRTHLKTWDDYAKSVSVVVKPETGLIGSGYFARWGVFYDGGYRSERQALNGLMRKIRKIHPTAILNK